MLPSFARTKEKIRIRSERELKKGVDEDPQSLGIRLLIFHEGNNLVTTSIDGYEDRGPLKEHQVRFEISDEEMREKGPHAIFEKIPTLAEDMAAQREKALFEKMHDVTERTGNVVEGDGKGLTPELIMETLKKIDISFDEHGNPIMPTLIVSPDVLKKMGENTDLWKETPEMQQKMVELIETKRREWDDRQNRRKLVD